MREARKHGFQGLIAERYSSCGREFVTAEDSLCLERETQPLCHNAFSNTLFSI